MMGKRDLYTNASGCSDPTAFKVICNAIKDKNEEDTNLKLKKFLREIYAICEHSDFYIDGKIEIVDKRTCMVYRRRVEDFVEK